jgi:hypothetical protein
VFLSRRKVEISSLKFRREIGIRVIAKEELTVGARIINATGINPRGTFAVIQTLGSN